MSRQGKRTGRGRPAFIPGWRIRQIKFEEAVTRSRFNRQGKPAPTIIHLTCHCGSLACLGIPIAK